MQLTEPEPARWRSSAAGEQPERQHPPEQPPRTAAERLLQALAVVLATITADKVWREAVCAALPSGGPTATANPLRTP